MFDLIINFIIFIWWCMVAVAFFVAAIAAMAGFAVVMLAVVKGVVNFIRKLMY